MTDREPNPATPPPATVAPPAAEGAAVVTPPPQEAVANLLFPALAPKAGESAATVITKPAILPAAPQMGQWATLIRGRRLSHFELEEPLGVGGMAAVIRAKDTLLDRTVALKILPPEMAADAENIQRFHNEARSAAQLDHENIARVYYYGEDQGLHFIAFEYVEGETLHHRLERQGRLTVAEALQITLQVAAGLVHAAARGVVHRDIKPSNIIVSRSGRAKLVDMGLARSIMTSRDKGLTQSGMTLGTFDYISPEQALDPRVADCRSDIYSLGCSLYQMLTGRPPVPEGTAARKLHAHQSEAPIDPRQLNPEIPDAVAAVLSRMMAKDPHDRYQRPEYLVQHLLQLLQQYGHSPVTATNERGQLFVETILPRPPKQDRGVLFLIAASILLGWLTLQRLLFPSAMPAQLNSFGQPEQVVKTTAPERLPQGDLPEGSQPPVVPAGPRTAQNATELQQALRNFSGDGTIHLTGTVYDLTVGDNGADACLLMTQGNLILQGSLDRRPVLRLRANPVGFAELGQEQSLLTQRGGSLTLRRVRIELEGGAGLTPMTALVVQGGLLTLEECELVQKDSAGQPGGDLPLTVLRAERAVDSKGGRSRVECRKCAFYGGQNGFVLEDQAQLQLHQCVVGAYRNPVRLQNRRLSLASERMVLEVTGCSWLLNGPALITTDNAQGRILVESSVISALAKPAAGPQSSYLWVQSGDRKDQTELRLKGNYFHGLNGLVAALDSQGEPMILAGTLEELANHKPALQDEGSIFSDTSPWAATDPLGLLADMEPRSALEAFRLKTFVRELRLASPERIKGAHQVLAQNLYSSLEPLPKEQSTTPPLNLRDLVVEPGPTMKPGTYPTISSALGAVEAEKEEVTIRLKVNGPMPVRTLDLGNRQIILKAEPGFKPELVLLADPVPAADGEAVLFRLHDGSLQLEQIALRLDGNSRDTAQLQSLVTITGTGRCKFLSCQATLLGENEPRAAVVALSDPTGAMSGMGGRPPRAGSPSIEVEDTLIRGRGDFLTVRASRPFQLEMRNAVVTLFGSLLSIDGNRSDMTPMIDTARASIKLERLTTYVTQSLVTLRSTLNQAVHVKVEIAPATTCLFATAEGSPLVRVDGVQNEQDLKRRLLFWNGDGNGYSTSGSLLIWQPLDRSAMPHQYNREGWGELWGRDEKEPRYAREVRFSGSLPLRSSFADITPSDLRVTSAEPSDLDLSGKGADLPRVFCLSEK